jgi:hypothetical protein
MLQMCVAEDEHNAASLFRRVQEMNNMLLGVQAHYAESGEYQPQDQTQAAKYGKTHELRGYFNRVWTVNTCCSPEEFTAWWYRWVAMLCFELNYIASLEQESPPDPTQHAIFNWKMYISGLRQQVDNAVSLLKEVRRSAYEIMPNLELRGFPEDAADVSDRRFIRVCGEP